MQTQTATLQNRFRTRSGAEAQTDSRRAWSSLFRTFGLTVIEFDSDIQVGEQSFNVAMFIEDWNCFAIISAPGRLTASDIPARALSAACPAFDVIVLASHPYGSTDSIRIFSQKLGSGTLDWRLKQVSIPQSDESALMLFDGRSTLYSPAINWLGTICSPHGCACHGTVTLRTPPCAPASHSYF